MKQLLHGDYPNLSIELRGDRRYMLKENTFSKYNKAEYMIMNQNSMFMSTLGSWVLHLRWLPHIVINLYRQNVVLSLWLQTSQPSDKIRIIVA